MAKTGRNDLCPCGSGKKYKRCHETQERPSAAQGRMLMVIVGVAVVAALLAGIASFTGTRAASTTRVWDASHGHYHNENGVQVP
jgi:SEC-C motif-containing protein